MKYGYHCKCGSFNLNRGRLTRKQYAAKKEEHALTCEILKDEMKQSGKLYNEEKGHFVVQ